MWLIAGLGNPGLAYRGTRHNVGFLVVDELASRGEMSLKKRKMGARYASGWLKEEEVTLIKPLTFMNRSGLSVGSAARWYKIEPKDLLVIHDDMDMEVGKLRIRLSGSSGGHRGLESIIPELGTTDFPRLKIGIGRPAENAEVVGHVLSPFAPDEKRVIDEAVARAADAVERIILEGYPQAMNRLNLP